MADRQGVEIDYCPQCRGVWLDRGELDKLIERSTAAMAPANPTMPMMDDDDYEDRRNYPPTGRQNPVNSGQYYPPQTSSQSPYPPKKKNFLGEMFDIFD
jgi:Zn-finger nucleic acid-binding protein